MSVPPWLCPRTHRRLGLCPPTHRRLGFGRSLCAGRLRLPERLARLLCLGLAPLAQLCADEADPRHLHQTMGEGKSRGCQATDLPVEGPRQCGAVLGADGPAHLLDGDGDARGGGVVRRWRGRASGRCCCRLGPEAGRQGREAAVRGSCRRRRCCLREQRPRDASLVHETRVSEEDACAGLRVPLHAGDGGGGGGGERVSRGHRAHKHHHSSSRVPPLPRLRACMRSECAKPASSEAEDVTTVDGASEPPPPLAVRPFFHSSRLVTTWGGGRPGAGVGA